jgi:hypothetical protein
MRLQDLLAYQKRQDDQAKSKMILEFARSYQTYLERLPMKVAYMECMSGLNRIKRSNPTYLVHAVEGINIGDVCFIDYGQAYRYEAGFQHFGIIMNIINNKVFVVPMTSNPETYSKANPLNDHPLPQLYQLGIIEGLNKESVCFLHDAKFINRARIIKIQGHIDPTSHLYRQLKQRLQETILPQ